MKNSYRSVLLCLWAFCGYAVAQSCTSPASDDLICRTYWKTTPIDNSRNAGGENCGGMNCWKYDDTVRDHLEMNPESINLITKLKNSPALPQYGRYIYVYRASDNNIYIRPYDRDASDRAAAFEPNCRTNTNQGNYPCVTRGAIGRYLHVRHSQLNGGWDPVWCAGEMRIEHGKICMANNESGHFKPDAHCLLYVENTLKTWNIPVADNAKFADYKKASASKPCSQLRDEL